MEEIVWINSVLCDPGRLSTEAKRRKDQFDHLSVAKSDVEEKLSHCWEIERELIRKTRLKKRKSHNVLLEDKVWFLFYLLGYPELSSGHNFKIRIERQGVDANYKQIDVFAKDDETVIVAECKSCKKISRRKLQKDIEEFANLRKPIANSIRAHYGIDSFKPKFIWLFITNNVIWSKQDRDRAIGENIQIITERELRYYLQIAEHLRTAARFQFHAEFLQDQNIPELEDVTVPAVRGKLGGKYFYSFVSTPRQILKIAFVNHRSLNDPDGAPTYQRLVNRTRMRQIGKFIENDGFFPTNILLNFTSDIRFDQIAKDDATNVKFGHLYLPNKYRSAWVIDGQHRLYGYAPLEDSYLDHNIMVVAFVNLSKVEEANLFVTINHEQKSVPKTLLADLEGDLKWGSDRPSERIGAINSRLIALLNNDIGEPFYNRVTQQGIPATEKTCLTIPALKDGLRRSGLVGRSVMKHKEYEPGPLSGLTDSKTLDRARSALESYFELFCTANNQLWEAGRSGFLCTNISIQAYLKLFESVISYMEANKGFTARELSSQEIVIECEEYLLPVISWLNSATKSDMESNFKVQFGSGGPREYYFRLCKMLKKRYSDFIPDGLEDWLEEQSSERITNADFKLKRLNILVQKLIFTVFKERYGTEKNAYWNKGIIDNKIKVQAYEKSLDDADEERLALEDYLTFIQYKKIVEHKQHWYLFKPIFDIIEPGEKSYTKNIRWMERINELRRIPAHPTEGRNYKLEDFEYIDCIHGQFVDNLLEQMPSILQES